MTMKRKGRKPEEKGRGSRKIKRIKNNERTL
jgi:hypothetical protein